MYRDIAKLIMYGDIDFADQYRIALGTFLEFPENLAHLI